MACQYGTHFGNDAPPSSPDSSPLLQFHLAPLNNILQELEKGDNVSTDVTQSPSPLAKVPLKSNDVVLRMVQEMEQNYTYQMVLSYLTVKAFLMRDMTRALEYSNASSEYAQKKDVHMNNFSSFYDRFYETLINLHHSRQTGMLSTMWIPFRYPDTSLTIHFMYFLCVAQGECRARAESALTQMRKWSKHSDWNLKNKVLLAEAEMHYTQKDFSKAASCYEAAVKTARKHKFIHEEAMANELAGKFFSERGLHTKAYNLFLRSSECYKKWGAFAVAKRLQDTMRNAITSDSMNLPAIPTPMIPFAIKYSWKESTNSTQKRQFRTSQP